MGAHAGHFFAQYCNMFSGCLMTHTAAPGVPSSLTPIVLIIRRGIFVSSGLLAVLPRSPGRGEEEEEGGGEEGGGGRARAELSARIGSGTARPWAQKDAG